MDAAEVVTLPRPRTEGRQLWDLVLNAHAFQALLVAHRLRLFPLLSEAPRTVTEVCESLELQPRPAQALLSTCAAHGFLELHGDRFALTPLADDYLLASSPTAYTPVLDFYSSNPRLMSYPDNEKAVLTNTAQAYGGDEVFKSHDEQAELARIFTRAMHSVSVPAATTWPDALDLSLHAVMLDVGGGSGAHSIGAASRWPRLDAIVLDLAPVCEVAEEFIADYGLGERIRTHAADMWQDEFPPADLHFYSNIYHDWPPEKGRLLTEKSYTSLPPGGRIVIHECLYDDDKCAPAAAGAYSVVMLMWSEGQQYSGAELTTMLTEAGFRDIEVRPTFAYNSIVTGVKPDA